MKLVKRTALCLVLVLALVITALPLAVSAATVESSALGNAFLMYVEDVYTITGRGTVATGRVVNGVVKTGQQLELRTFDATTKQPKTIQVTAVSIEMFHKTLEEAQAGDNVGILLSGATASQIQRGDALVDRGSPIRSQDTSAVCLGTLTVAEGKTVNVNESYSFYWANDMTASVFNAWNTTLAGSTSTLVQVNNLAHGVTWYTGQTLKVRRGGVEYATFTVTGFMDPDITLKMNVPGVPFAVSNPYPWLADADAAVCGNHGVPSSRSSLFALVSTDKPAVYTFDFRLQGEGANTAYDAGSFLLNGQTLFTYGARHNETQWELKAVALPAAGDYLLEWRYTKDQDVNPTGDLFAVRNMKAMEYSALVNLDANGGTVETNFAILDTEGNVNSLPAPVWPGHRFVGWYTGKRGGERVSSGHQCEPNSTLYAWWDVTPGLVQGFYFENDDPADEGWTFRDADGDGENWCRTHNNWVPHEGVAMLTSYSWRNHSALTPDNWAVSPAITLPKSDRITLSFRAASGRNVDAEFGNEVMSVYVGADPDHLTELIAPTEVEGRVGAAVSDFSLYTADLTAYAGQTVHLAFRHNGSSDVFYLALDNVEITFEASSATLYGVCAYDHEGEIPDRTLVTLQPAAPAEVTASGLQCEKETYAVAWNNGTVYAFDRSGGYWTGPESDFGRHVCTENEQIAQMGTPVSMTYDFTRKALFVLVNCRDENVLARLDPATGNVIDTVKWNKIFLNVAADENGLLYMIENRTGDLYRADPDTGDVALVGSTGQKAEYAQDMCYDYDTGALLWAQVSSTVDMGLCWVNKETGAAVSLGIIGAEGMEITGMYNHTMPKPDGLPGDVNLDGTVDARDALLALKTAVGKAELTDQQTALADLDKNDKVDARDALMILKIAVGKLDPATL